MMKIATVKFVDFLVFLVESVNAIRTDAEFPTRVKIVFDI